MQGSLEYVPWPIDPLLRVLNSCCIKTLPALASMITPLGKLL